MSSVLSSNIKHLMLDYGIKSVKELADKVNMRSQTLGLIIRDESINPRDNTLQPLADFFNISINDLLGVDDTFSFQNNLDNIMSYCGLNDYKLSEVSGVPRETINSILSGLAQKPNDTTVKKLANVFNVSIDQMKGIKPIDLKEIENSMSVKKIPLLYKRDLNQHFSEKLVINQEDVYKQTNSKFTHDNQMCIQSYDDLCLNGNLSKFKLFFTSDRIHNRQKSIFYNKKESNLFFCKEIMQKESTFLQLEDIFSKPILMDYSLMRIGYLISITSQT